MGDTDALVHFLSFSCDAIELQDHLRSLDGAPDDVRGSHFLSEAGGVIVEPLDHFLPVSEEQDNGVTSELAADSSSLCFAFHQDDVDAVNRINAPLKGF